MRGAKVFTNALKWSSRGARRGAADFHRSFRRPTVTKFSSDKESTYSKSQVQHYSRIVTVSSGYGRHALQGNALSDYRSTGSTHRNVAIAQRWQSGVGAEPGIDLSQSDLTSDRHKQKLVQDSEIKVIDYSNAKIEQHDLANESFQPFLATQPKPDWAACRWIYINGLSWDAVRSLSNHMGFHRLVIEDVLDTTTPTKVDWYNGYCFMEMTLQKLLQFHQDEEQRRRFGHHGSTESDFERQSHNSHRILSPGTFGMSVEQVSMFMTADNTIVTIFEHSGSDVLGPILTRLNLPETIVRSSNDPSMLVQAVVDTIVDLSIPIAKAVNDAFRQLEMEVLTTPAIAQSKQLYVLRSGLTVLNDNIIALGGLVRTLCDHHAVPPPSMASSRSSSAGATKSTQQLSSGGIFISPMTQVYLQDVQDHVLALSNSTHQSIRSAENLTSLIFNTIAASQNESVRQLTLVSCFFLPLTFLTGYFGMNFDPMPAVNQHSDLFFWAIATPVSIGMLLFAGRGRLYRSMRSLRRSRAAADRLAARRHSK